MASNAGALTSRVGRRFVLLFAGGALVPLVVFATLAVMHIGQQAEVDVQSKLHDSAKSAGMGLAARLSQIAGDLALTAELVERRGVDRDWAGGATLLRHVADRCRSVTLLGDGPPELLCGDEAEAPFELSAADREHLAIGKPIARFVGSPPELVMVAAADATHAERLIAARARNSWLWDPEELRGPQCEFAAFDMHGQLLFHTFDSPPPAGSFVGELQVPLSSGTFRWHIGDDEHVARYWRAFLRPQYQLDLVLVQSQSLWAAAAVTSAFVWTFWWTAAGTLLLVVLVSLVQIRRTLGPIVQLRDATRRLGQGDLGARVQLERDDEFGDLGRTFDEMAGRLQLNIGKRVQTERELIASRDAALAAVRAKATFLTNVSHELRTPMAEILSAAEILTMLEDSEVEAREEFSGIALKGAQRLAGLLDDVLALDETGPGEAAATDVGEVVRAAVAGMPEAARARVAIALPDELPEVLGDAGRLGEVFARLLDNAVKFSAPDTPIEIRASVDGARIAVAVVDRGAGIDPADHERIFEPFCQVGRDQMIDKASGTGLGLSLARSVVQAHGGTIELESAPGRGATFRVMLPVHLAAPVN